MEKHVIEKNIKEVGEFLKKNKIDEKYAEILSNSGVLYDPNQNSSLYMCADEETKSTYLYSTFRDYKGYWCKSNDNIKVFLKDEMLLVYNLHMHKEERHYVMDMPDTWNDYYVTNTSISIINPITEHEIIKLYGTDETTNPISIIDIMSKINSDNIITEMSKLNVKIVNNDEYNSLRKEGEIFTTIENKIKKQEELKKKKEVEKEKNMFDTNNKKISFFKSLKRKRSLLKFIKANNGLVNISEPNPGNYLLTTNLDIEELNIPSEIKLKEKIEFSTDLEKNYSILDLSGDKIGSLKYTSILLKENNNDKSL